MPAKVNLFLRVGSRRPDGYHSIETVFHSVGLWDEIVIKPSGSFGFSAAGLPSPAGKDNLCVRAFNLLKPLAPSGAQVSIRLKKGIPAGAGLGGGSADAAACLAGLNGLWRLGLDRRELRRLAAKLGSDVPFFIEGGAALGTGRGEKLETLRSRLDRWCAVLKPAFGVSTRAAYRRLDSPRSGRPPARISSAATVSAVRRGSAAGLVTRNDFEPVISGMHPKLGLMLGRMREAGLSPVFMTGSGSAVVGLAKNAKAARSAARSLGRKLGAWSSAARLAPFRMKLLSRP